MSGLQDQRGQGRHHFLRTVLLPAALRYGVALLAFVLILLLALAFRYYSIQLDFSLLIVAALMAVAWYAGAGPGLLLALLLELGTLALSNPRHATWPRFLLAELNRTALLAVLVWLVCSRKRAERQLRDQHERLRASEERFSKAFYASPVPMSIVTHEDGRYLDVNESFLRNSGYAREEVVGRTTTELGIYADPEDRARLRRILDEQGVILNMEVCRRVKGGEARVALTSSVLIELNGERCILTTSSDITESKQLQEQLLQAQKMEAVGRLAGGVAHDFNNLLTAIIGYSQLIRRGLKKSEPIYSQIAEVEKAGQRAAALTGQLLAFSRKQVLQPRILNLNAEIADFSKMLQRLIGEDIELSTNLDLRISSVMADPDQIGQVVMNLAVNARDAMPGGGKLTIETRNVHLDASYASQHVEIQPGHYVMLAVSDTGCGMDKATQARIFEPFFTTKEKDKGTGLGLSTVYGIVKQSGGHIWVYSEPGEGTSFKIYLPVAEGEFDAEREPAPAPALPSGTETILLVEDEDGVRHFTRQVLEMNGYTVLEVGNPKEAIGLADSYEGHIDLLVTDVVMPGMGGRELAISLTLRRPATKVLFISGYTDKAIVHHGMLESGTPFLPKPFTPEGLLRKVREVMNAQA